jgi:hypothetical protein
MSLPTSRDYNAADSGALNASVVNNLQDAIVGHGHGTVSRFYALEGSRWIGCTLDAGADYWKMAATAGNKYDALVPCRPGDRIISVTAYVRDIVGDRIQGQLRHRQPLSAWASAGLIGAAVNSDNSGSDQAIVMSPASPFTVLADQPVELGLIPAGATYAGGYLRIYPAILVTYDHP